MAGGRELRKNSQTTGSHKAGDVFVSRAGSKQNRDTRRTAQIKSANEGGMCLYDLLSLFIG
jgi:hypothetical protein